ncbi:HlyD family type I secretion periplasmic adaptor subunit [Rhodanobacter sp. DHB23]|uniref:HlyD family type I secretion periplasmic adaptor subunit n=1 Tax=Rhodanobacter sp. DHB23 TaxID=2775923 RepID=UPI00178722AE|nr:HlyD family type I secretion periplasmic adaptor subunit [Rhodanobacter sp. DHB23]MBD8873498.1 HlyD family type I secretion periplasmic adaptor subunit [Rhodanobacter sp. DHB23]
MSLPMRWQAWGDLAGRYAQVARVAWQGRGELETLPRLRHESEFLPAALALRDTPVHPAPRVAMHLIMALCALALGWAVLGKVDVVASEPGQIAPSSEIKSIQSQDTAVVTAIHVVDGQVVKQGEPLIDLDATDAATTAAQTSEQLDSTQGEAARARALLQAIDTQQAPKLSGLPGLSAADLAEQQHVLAGEYTDYTSTLQELNADIAQSTASLHETEADIRSLEGTLPIEEKKLSDYAQLVGSGYVGLHDYYDEQQSVIQMRQNLAQQRAKRGEMQAALAAATQKRDAYVAQTRRQWLEKQTTDETQAAGLQQTLIKAQQHRRLMHLVAPVDGTVQQLAVHTLGGVVTPAQVLMTVVPTQRQLIVEADVDNQDIGFIHAGQPVQVKVQTFPFTRYGTLQGTVLQVSNDAKQDEQKRWVFPARIALARASMQVDGREIPLVPGMAVTAEIKTGRRRIIGYLLSPLVQHARESLHER